MKQNFIFRQTILARSVLAVCGASAAVLAVQPAMAQNAPALQRVEVTGSNIPRTNTETAAPVQVITAEEMKASGLTSVTEVLQNLTANGNGTLNSGFSGAFAAGATGVSLRGLTLGATLVLIDGRRMAPYPLSDDAQRSFVDISSIPFASIERIEVLKDGASAIYGSDAMAGVVNVILKRSIEGASVSADLGNTQQGGGANRAFSAAYGFGNADSTSKGYISLEARHRDAIKYNQRSGDWTRGDWRADGGVDLRPGAVSSVITNSRVLTPRLQPAVGASATNPATNAFLGSGCNFTAWRASDCVYENTWSQLQPETDNLNLLGRFETKISNDWDLRLTASRFQSKARTTTTKAALPAASVAGLSTAGLGITPTLLPNITNFFVPASYPGNPFGTDAITRGYLPDRETRSNDIETVATRLVGEVRGIQWGWDIDAALGFTTVETKQEYNGYIHFENLKAAYRNTTTPFLLTGGNSAAVMASVSPTVRNTVKSSLNFLELRANRELMPLAGGPLGLGVGFGYSYKDILADVPNETKTGAMALPVAYTAGTEKNTSAYAELNAPVTKSLELGAAVRVDNFDTYGTSTTPKLSFKFTPMKQLAIRGTASAGFRAPSASENGTAGSTFAFNTFRDPLLCPVVDANGVGIAASPQNVQGACNLQPAYSQGTTKSLEPEKSKSFTLGIIAQPTSNWSATLDYYRVQIDNQIIPETNVSTFDPLPRAVRSAPTLVTFGDGRQGISPAGQIAYVDVGYVNGQSTVTTGIEFDTKYKFNFGENGSLTTGLQFTRVFSYKQTINGVEYEFAGTHDPSAVGGNTGTPQNRAQVSFAYNKGPFTITTTTNYVGSYNVTEPSAGNLTCQAGATAHQAGFSNGATVPTKYCTIGEFMYTNLTAKYQYNKALTLRGSILNLFGAEPPVDVNTYGSTRINTDSAGSYVPYNPAFHQAGAVGRSFSIGLDYKF